MKKVFAMLVAVCFMVILLPMTASATVSGNDLYNAGDVAAIQKIIDASPTLTEKYDKNNPASWDNNFVQWGNEGTEMRAIGINLGFYSADGSNWEWVTDFSGILDVSKLVFLNSLECGGNANLTKLVLPESGSLTTLRCLDTGITELDISAQTNLTYLECYNCEGLTVLDVSKNTKLTHLDFEQTPVSSVDLSMLTELNVLWCSYTNITALDVSKNTKLETLHCNDTAIMALDLTNNPMLVFLNCTNTKITALNVSGNPNLQYLYCENTGITALNLSANTSLMEVRYPNSSIGFTTPEGHKITLQQPTDGKLSLSVYDDGSGRVYTLVAFANPGYELIRFTGVTNKISENSNLVSFTVTGDMTLSAEFAMEERLLLTALSIEGVQLSPAFSGNVYNYTASVEHDVDNINVLAQAADGYELRIDGDGMHPLEVGENTFVVTIIVPAIPGISDINNPNEVLTVDYTITITREESSESDSESESDPEPNPNSGSTSIPKLDDVPKTGDDSRVGFWLVLMMISIVTLTAWAVMLRQNNDQLP